MKSISFYLVWGGLFGGVSPLCSEFLPILFWFYHPVRATACVSCSCWFFLVIVGICFLQCGFFSLVNFREGITGSSLPAPELPPHYPA